MQTRINFTKAVLDGLAVPVDGQRFVFHDVKTPGLELRITSKGAKTFSLRRRVKGGELERHTIGRYPDVSVDQARRHAAALTGHLAVGESVVAAKRLRKSQITFADLFGQYLARHSKPRKRTWREDESKYKAYLARLLGPRKIQDITRQEIAAVHSKITADGHSTTANRVLALASSVFGWGISAGLGETNPARGIKRNPERSRDRFLQPDELPRFFRALAVEPNETIRDFFLMCLLTGARRSNVLTMRWRDISFERAEWRIPRTKNNTAQVVTLTPEAVKLLEDRRGMQEARESREGADAKELIYVFEGTGKRGHLIEPKKGWERVLLRAGALGFVEALAHKAQWPGNVEREAVDLALTLPAQAMEKYAEEGRLLHLKPADFAIEDLRVHDLRRTLGSWQARTGASLAIIGKSLNHKSVQTTAIYARLDQDPVRASVRRATDAMLVAAGLKQAAEAVELDSARVATERNHG